MQAFTSIVLAVQILTAIGMVGLILVQHGKGADMGAAFGSGSSGSLFGASGSANFLSRTTAVMAAIFFASTLVLAYFSHSVAPSEVGGSVLERAGVAAPAPAASAAGAAGQIPKGAAGVPAAPAPAAAAPAAPAATPASGAAQIPTK